MSKFQFRTRSRGRHFSVEVSEKFFDVETSGELFDIDGLNDFFYFLRRNYFPGDLEVSVKKKFQNGDEEWFPIYIEDFSCMNELVSVRKADDILDLDDPDYTGRAFVSISDDKYFIQSLRSSFLRHGSVEDMIPTAVEALDGAAYEIKDSKTGEGIIGTSFFTEFSLALYETTDPVQVYVAGYLMYEENSSCEVSYNSGFFELREYDPTEGWSEPIDDPQHYLGLMNCRQAFVKRLRERRIIDHYVVNPVPLNEDIWRYTDLFEERF